MNEVTYTNYEPRVEEYSWNPRSNLTRSYNYTEESSGMKRSNSMNSLQQNVYTDATNLRTGKNHQQVMGVNLVRYEGEVNPRKSIIQQRVVTNQNDSIILNKQYAYVPQNQNIVQKVIQPQVKVQQIEVVPQTPVIQKQIEVVEKPVYYEKQVQVEKPVYYEKQVYVEDLERINVLVSKVSQLELSNARLIEENQSLRNQNIRMNATIEDWRSRYSALEIRLENIYELQQRIDSLIEENRLLVEKINRISDWHNLYDSIKIKENDLRQTATLVRSPFRYETSYYGDDLLLSKGWNNRFRLSNSGLRTTASRRSSFDGILNDDIYDSSRKNYQYVKLIPENEYSTDYYSYRNRVPELNQISRKLFDNNANSSLIVRDNTDNIVEKASTRKLSNGNITITNSSN